MNSSVGMVYYLNWILHDVISVYMNNERIIIQNSTKRHNTFIINVYDRILTQIECVDHLANL